MSVSPKFEFLKDEYGIYSFRLSNVNVSIANAIRRTIISDIPTVCFITETEATNQCKITENTSRFHNEIVKQRLSCIPVFEKVSTVKNNEGVLGTVNRLSGKYLLELDMENTGDNVIYITTDDFKIKNKTNGEYMTQEETHKLFPPDPISNRFIDFIRLRPAICDTIMGEKLKLTAEFSVSTSGQNNSFNVVSKCAYANTMDRPKVETILEDQSQKWKKEGMTEKEVKFQEKNYILLDAQRHFIPDSFDFVIQSIGIYDNRELVRMACSILINKFKQYFYSIESDGNLLSIESSNTAMENCYDIRLENESYTVGKVIEYFIYDLHFLKDKTVSYCGFKKNHPHDDFSIVRIAFTEKIDIIGVQNVVKNICKEAETVFQNIQMFF